jgi:hypothetical protein
MASWSILRPVGILCGRLVYSMVTYFGIYSLYVVPRKIWQPCFRPRLAEQMKQMTRNGLTWARSIRKNLSAVTESRKHQFDFLRLEVAVAAAGSAAVAFPVVSSGPCDQNQMRVGWEIEIQRVQLWTKVSTTWFVGVRYHDSSGKIIPDPYICSAPAYRKGEAPW